jgi:hypothetical protein
VIGRQFEETSIAGLMVKAQPLLFSAAKPLLPDVGEFIARLAVEARQAIASGIVPLELLNLKRGATPTLEDLKKLDLWKLIDRLDPTRVRGLLEVLTKHDIKIMSCTIVVMPGDEGELENHELSKEKDRNAVFDAHPEAYIPILLFAGRVTFSRFFPGIARRDSATPSESS